jgi:hypothetical protein
MGHVGSASGVDGNVDRRPLPIDASSSHGDRAAALLRDEKRGEADGRLRS